MKDRTRFNILGLSVMMAGILISGTVEARSTSNGSAARKNSAVSVPEAELIRYLNSTELDRAAFSLMARLDITNRINAVMGVLRDVERLLLLSGWSRCSGTPEASDQSPFGQRYFVKSSHCFYSALENATWLTNFISAPLEEQSILFAAIERLRRTLARERADANMAMVKGAASGD